MKALVEIEIDCKGRLIINKLLVNALNDEEIKSFINNYNLIESDSGSTGSTGSTEPTTPTTPTTPTAPPPPPNNVYCDPDYPCG